MDCSLIVPCHNSAATLPRLFEGVRAQTLRYRDVVCYDDASTDDTASIAESLGMRVIRGKKNLGPYGARNAALAHVDTEWVHLHDSDDILNPRFLERMATRAGDDVDVIVCDADWLYPNGKPEQRLRYDSHLIETDPIAEGVRQLIGVNNMIVRRSKLLAIGGFKIEMGACGDEFLPIDLARHGARFRHVPEVLTTCVRHGRGISADRDRAHRGHLAVFRWYAENLPPRYHPTVARKVNLYARWTFKQGRIDLARRYLAIGRMLGAQLPEVRSPLGRLIRGVLPPMATLALQDIAFRARYGWRTRLTASGTATR